MTEQDALDKLAELEADLDALTATATEYYVSGTYDWYVASITTINQLNSNISNSLSRDKELSETLERLYEQ